MLLTLTELSSATAMWQPPPAPPPELGAGIALLVLLIGPKRGLVGVGGTLDLLYSGVGG